MSVEIMRVGGGVKQLMERFEQLRKKGVYVGIPKANDETVEQGFNLASLAAVLEFGNVRIPSRPFLRKTLADNQQKYTALFLQWLKDGVSVDVIYQRLAMVAQGDVQENIVKGGWTPNAKSTIKRKGSSKPLIDTGRLRQSIVGVVRDD